MKTVPSMKKVTFTANEELIAQARQVARSQRKTLNSAFCEWLEQYTSRPGDAQEFEKLMDRLQHVRPGQSFSRKEMNQR